MGSAGSARFSGAGVLEDLYREVILRHYQSPRNRRAIPDPSAESFAQNPLCGDEISVCARIDDGRIVDAGFQARSCSIVQASADMMADVVRGKTLMQVSDLIGMFRAMMANGADRAPEELGDLAALQGVRRYPVRVKCALLPWNTLADALQLYGARG